VMSFTSRVEVSVSNIISELGELTKNQDATLSAIPAKSLGLWKVDVAFDDLRVRLGSFNEPEHFPGSEELMPWDKISEHWHEVPHGKRLHVVVHPKLALDACEHVVSSSLR
jgi:hypothetical protein